MKSSSIVILDNGASTIKAGLLGVHDDQPLIIPNAVVRSKGDNATYIGHELAKCRDYTSIRYRLPFEKGFLVDWDAQKAVWDGIFSSDVLGVNTSEASLLITEPYFNLPNVQDVYDQFVFEEYEFQSYCRIDVGGKLMTNHLKEIISFRQWNLMEETHIVNEVKEACCFVSDDFTRDLEACRVQPTRNAIVQEYIFPDYSANRPGRIRRAGETLDDSRQTLVMNNERFTVPEILARAGWDKCNGGGEHISPPGGSAGHVLGQHRPDRWQHRLTGLSPATSELRSLAPIKCDVVVFSSEHPILEAYYSAVAFAARPEFAQCVVTKEEYQESGSNACRRKFRDWKPVEKEATRSREQGKGKGIESQMDVEGDDIPPPTKKTMRGRGRGRGAARRQV
ncbi:hypothetical protein ONZ51_g4748 [Trametes cubensis]|uniref:Actin-like protein ARP6 n=1 Tax=Trametes cubensis TaxID=1111947 RepID=A0AAD7TXP4_9APHY|nr:hypothetical protein ONZ51_g4748 [Trametes cubensis]